MVEERDVLVRRVFPVLRELCESRGVAWGEVDLRWGITDEQVAEGRVLPVCLEEVRGCRPYFIGLLGERYGWVLDRVPEVVVEREPWLLGLTGRSVTELEILQGVLNDPAMADHAFFYFRDPTFVARAPGWREVPVREEVERFGEAEAQSRARERAEKLTLLKERIRASGVPVREDYRDPEALGGLVLEDLRQVIDGLFPVGSEPSPLDREAGLHEGLARGRAEVYVGRGEYFERLDAHAVGDGPPLVVVGESGIGKSALLANWALDLRDRSGDAASGGRGSGPTVVVMHFVGASPDSADVLRLMRRVIGELDRELGLGVEVPEGLDELRVMFADALFRSAASGRVVLVIDGLNQLEDQAGALDLAWLPPVIPPGVRMVLSTLPGRPLDALRERGWPMLEVNPLEPSERRLLISETLRPFRKQLALDQVERIADAEQCANPMFLRLMLDELRLHPGHETLGARIEELLGAVSIPELYDQIFARWEGDLESDRDGLVRDAMVRLWATRRGLSEDELRDLLGSSGSTLPGAYWSPLRLATRQTLISRSGLLGFAHDYARTAVEQRYLPRDHDQRLAHRRLATYFAKISENTVRRLEELPWQLARSQQWSELCETLANPAFMAALEQTAPFELRGYWSQLEAKSPFRLADTYAPVIAGRDTQDEQQLWSLARLLSDTGHPEQALALWADQERHFRELGDLDGLQISLGNQAAILQARGDLDGALAMHTEEERICRELGDRDGLQASLGNQALILQARGDLDDALALLKETERIYRELGNRDGLQVSLGNQALILRERGDLDGALALLKETERIYRELGNPDRLQLSLVNQAAILQARGDLDGALALHKEAERICRELGNRDALARSLSGQAMILRARGDLDGALALHKEAERIYRELDNRDGLARSLGGQGVILQARGDLDGALALHKEAERIFRELGNPYELQVPLANQAAILQARGDLDGALALLKETERIFRKLDNPDRLANSLDGQAVILGARGDLDGALALHKEAERIFRELDNPDELARSLVNQAAILQARGDLDGALALLKETERIFRELDNPDGLARSLEVQAAILHARGDLDGALALYEEVERIRRDLDNPDGHARSLDGQGVILAARGDLDGALALHKEAERIFRGLDNPDGLASSLGNQAAILQARGDLDGALALLKETERIWRDLDNPDGLANSLKNQAIVLHARGDLQMAIELVEDALKLATEHGYRDLARQINAIRESILSGQSAVRRWRLRRR